MKEIELFSTKICEWFVVNKLTIDLGENKTKYILFSEKQIQENLKIVHKNMEVKLFDSMEYLECILDWNLSEVKFPTKVLIQLLLNKILT